MRGRPGVGLGWVRRGRGARGEQAERIGRGEQVPASGVLLLQLLGFVFDLLCSRVDRPDPQLAGQHALPGIGIAKPVGRLNQSLPSLQH